jgi:glycine hydroxymethyltransferase
MIYTKIENILKKEKNRQKNTFELIASENFASKAVRKLCGSVFTNKYAEGYPGKRYYNGCLHMDEIEQLAIDNLKKLYSSEFANVQPHCGANANTAVYQAFLTPGDTILGMDLASGGHLSHGAKVNISGKIFNSVHYGVDKNGWLDYNQIATLAQLHKPKMIIAGASAYPRKIDWKTIKDICKQHDCLFMVDIAHYSGLIAGKVYPSPVEYADVVTSTTHKTLRGPRGGFILWNNPDYSKKINSAVFPGTQGGPLMNIIAAKAQAFMEANTRDFQWYSRNVISNAEAMAEVFTSNGFQVQTGGTDSHILLLNLSDKKYSGKEAADILEENGITVNKNGIPNDPRSFVETSGIRIGTAAETTRGHKQNDFKKIAKDICNILS